MEHFTPWSSTLGGLLIGLASLGLVLATRRVAGISGVLGGLFSPRTGDWAWRLAFGVGLIGTGALLYRATPEAFDLAAAPSFAHIVVAGLLVGFGTRLGNGCTSGHGVCGISRMSPRSLVATATFMLAGGVTVWLLRAVGVVS